MWPFRNKWKDLAEQAEAAIEGWADANDEWRAKFCQSDTRVGNLERALERIAEQETEGANATVKRMARIAREALGGERRAVTPKVDALPVPGLVDVDEMRRALGGDRNALRGAFVFADTPQGHDYWGKIVYNGGEFTEEHKAILRTWIAELENNS